MDNSQELSPTGDLFCLVLKINFNIMEIFRASDFRPIWIVLGFTFLAIIVFSIIRILLQRLFNKIKNRKT